MGLFDFNFNLGSWRIPWFRPKPKVILCVEDHPLTAQLIRLAADSHGVVVELATTAEEAKGALHRNGKRFVLVMIDVRLPGMSGWELRKEIMDLWPELEVVVMSASRENLLGLPEGEMVSVLVKTSNFGEAIRKIRSK